MQGVKAKTGINYSKYTRALSDDETRQTKALRRRPHKKWIAMVAGIKDPLVRVHIASIIWWDFFDRKGSAASRQDEAMMYQYVKAWRRTAAATSRQIKRGLMKFGYPQVLAGFRAETAVRMERAAEHSELMKAKAREEALARGEL
jgi:hypothetical protein